MFVHIHTRREIDALTAAHKHAKVRVIPALLRASFHSFIAWRDPCVLGALFIRGKLRHEQQPKTGSIKIRANEIE
jgi:hypothetical protein